MIDYGITLIGNVPVSQTHWSAWLCDGQNVIEMNKILPGKLSRKDVWLLLYTNRKLWAACHVPLSSTSKHLVLPPCKQYFLFAEREREERDIE